MAVRVHISPEDIQRMWRTDPDKARAMREWIDAAGWDATTVRSLTISPRGVLVEHICTTCEHANGQRHGDPERPNMVHTYKVVRMMPAAPPPWLPDAVPTPA